METEDTATPEPVTYVFGYPDHSEQYQNCTRLQICENRTGHVWSDYGKTTCEIAAGWETMASFSEPAYTEVVPVVVTGTDQFGVPVTETIPVVASPVTLDVIPSPEPEAGASSTEITPDVPDNAPHVAEVVTDTAEG